MQNRSLKLLPVLTTYFVMGFVDIVGVSTGYAKRDFNLSPMLAQLIPSMVFIWFFVLSIPLSLLQSTYGKKRLLIAGTVLTAIGMFLPFIDYSYPALLGSFLLLGFGNTIIQVSSNPLLRDVTSPEEFSSFLSLSQFVKATSSLLGPLLVALAVTIWNEWKGVFLVYGCVSLLTSVWLIATKIREEPVKKGASLVNPIGLLKNRYVLMMVLAIFFLVGLDVGLNTNIQSILQSRFHLSLENASLGISVYFFSLMASRLLGAFVLSRIDNLRFFMISSFMTIIFLLIVIYSPSATIAFFAIGLTGLASGNLFPLIFAMTLNRMPDRANEVSGLMIMAVVGGALIPPLVGYTQNFVSVTSSFLLLLGCAVYIHLASLFSKSKSVKIYA